jgi:membrane dipeptidase
VGAGDGGLTDLGRSVVQAMADLGMVTDLSHASATTFWDCIGLQTGNVVATHSNAAALKSHPRNLTDDQLKALGEQGGVVGACALPDFLPGDAPGLSELVDQIAYIGELIGIEHVGIGFDLFDYLPEAEARARLALSATSSGPDRDPYPNYIKGLEGVRRTSALTTLLVERGFAAGDIRGVLGGNIARAWQAVEARSGKARAAGA